MRGPVASLAILASLLFIGACSNSDSNNRAPFIGQGSGGTGGGTDVPDASVDGAGGDGAGGDGQGGTGHGGKGGKGGGEAGNANAGGSGQGGNANAGGTGQGGDGAGGTGQGGTADGGLANAGGSGGQGGTGGDGAGGARTCSLSVGKSACDNCIHVKCNDPCLNCEDDVECTAIVQCVNDQGCFGGTIDQTCLNTCKAAHTAGVNLVNKVVQCGLVCSGFGC